MKLFQWHFSLYLLPLAFLLPVSNTQAALSVNCEASMNTVNFGTITSTNANTASTTGTLSYSCKNTGNTAGYVSVCLAADGGQYTQANVTTRYMQRPEPGTDAERRLNFTMKLPSGTIWSTRGNLRGGAEYNSGSLAIGANSTVTGSVVITVAMKPTNTSATAGAYTNNFALDGSHTALTFKARESSPALNCATGAQGEGRFAFTVQAAIAPSCTIAAKSNVELGPHSANETNITGSNSSAITVNCTNGGAYYIGLKPFNNSTTGAGVMSGTGGNLDKVPYQLRSTDGIDGKVWGNTATSTTVGNGVAGFGIGANKTHEVFVTVPSADFKPDNYSDTVTINVNY